VFMYACFLKRKAACKYCYAVTDMSHYTVGQARKVHETTTFLLVTVPNIHRF